jgi:hypothetical protein
VSDRDTKVSVEQCISHAAAKAANYAGMPTGEMYQSIATYLRSLQPASGEKAVCGTCNDRGEVGGHRGQTPESFEYVTEPCPDCTPPTEQAKQTVLVVDDAPYNAARDDGPEASPPDPFGTDKAAGEDLSLVFWSVRNTHQGQDSYFAFTDDGWTWTRKAEDACHFLTREDAQERVDMLLSGGSPYAYAVVRVTVPVNNPSPPTAPAAGMTEADASTIERGALACDAVSKTYSEPWRAQIWRTHAAELRSLAARLGGGK